MEPLVLLKYIQASLYLQPAAWSVHFMKNSCKYKIFSPSISLSLPISPLSLLSSLPPLLSLCLSPRPSPPHLSLSPASSPLSLSFGANLLKLFFYVSIHIMKTEWSNITPPSIRTTTHEFVYRCNSFTRENIQRTITLINHMWLLHLSSFQLQLYHIFENWFFLRDHWNFHTNEYSTIDTFAFESPVTL